MVFKFYLPSTSFLIFCCIGILNTSVNYGIFLFLMNYFGVYYLYAGAVGFFSGAITGFFLNTKYTFKRSISIMPNLSAYLLLQLFCLIVSCCIQAIVVLNLFIRTEWSQVMSIIVTLLLNYFISKKYVFLIRESNEGGGIKSE